MIGRRQFVICSRAGHRSVAVGFRLKNPNPTQTTGENIPPNFVRLCRRFWRMSVDAVCRMCGWFVAVCNEKFVSKIRD